MVKRFDPARPASVLVASLVLGAVAGLVAALFLTVAGEPSIEEAIAIEQAASAASGGEGGGDEPADELVSRSTQKGIGLFSAYAVSGAAFGMLFGAGYVGLARRHPDPLRRALVTGSILAGALTVSPWLKYPPNPPAVGDPDTLSERQLLYVTLVALTAIVLVGTDWMAGRLERAGWAAHRRLAAVGGATLAVALAVYALLPPAPDAVGVPATLVWRFRVASLGGNLLLWGVLTAGMAYLVGEKSADARRQALLAAR